MSSTQPSIPNSSKPSVWWKESWLWLVLIGPLVVVVAGLITLVIAIRGADTLVDSDYYQKGLALSKGQRQLTDEGMLPAKQARNHAATAAEKSRPSPAPQESGK